jgi:hypothetical protein
MPWRAATHLPLLLAVEPEQLVAATATTSSRND